MSVNGVIHRGARRRPVGVPASSPRGRPARSDALWQGVAGGGIAVSYTMGTRRQDHAGRDGHRGRADHAEAAGGGVRHARHRRGRTPWSRDATARALGAPAGNAIVVSVRRPTSPPRRRRRAADPQGRRRRAAGLADQYRRRSAAVTGGTGAAGAGQLTESAVPQTALNAMLSGRDEPPGHALRLGRRPGRDVFDCSGLVQWSFAQAGHRHAAGRRRPGADRPGRPREPAPAGRPALLPHRPDRTRATSRTSRSTSATAG